MYLPEEKRMARFQAAGLLPRVMATGSSQETLVDMEREVELDIDHEEAVTVPQGMVQASREALQPLAPRVRDPDVVEMSLPAKEKEDWDTPPSSPCRPRLDGRRVTLKSEVSVRPKHGTPLQVTVPGNSWAPPARQPPRRKPAAKCYVKPGCRGRNLQPGVADLADLQCFTCGEWGHMSKNCRSKSTAGQECFTCGELGHRRWECPNDRATGYHHRRWDQERDASRERERRDREDHNRRRDEDRAVEDAFRDFVRDMSEGHAKLGKCLSRSRLGGHH